VHQPETSLRLARIAGQAVDLDFDRVLAARKPSRPKISVAASTRASRVRSPREDVATRSMMA
jgi:hypothetical protein